jgi:hypothetical protein
MLRRRFPEATVHRHANNGLARPMKANARHIRLPPPHRVVV